MNIELSDQERELLLELLHNDRMNLREEIMNTDDHHYKDMLKARELLLVRLIAKAEAGSAVGRGSDRTV